MTDSATATYRQVHRNEDKPHRCPACHAVCFRGSRGRFSRPKVRCDDCCVWWRLPLRPFQT